MIKLSKWNQWGLAFLTTHTLFMLSSLDYWFNIELKSTEWNSMMLFTILDFPVFLVSLLLPRHIIGGPYHFVFYLILGGLQWYLTGGCASLLFSKMRRSPDRLNERHLE